MMPATYEAVSMENYLSSGSAVAKVKRPAFELDPLSDPRWKIFVDAHPDASVFHTIEWLQALKSCYGYAPVALTFSPPGSALTSGLVLCEVRSPLTGNRLVSLPFSDHCEPLVGSPEELDSFLLDLTERVQRNRYKYFELRPLLRSFDERKDIGVCQNYQFHRLDLRPSEQKLFKNFHKDCIQRKIRRAEREGLRYEEGTSEALLQHFYKLMISTRRRQGLPPQPLKWFRSVVSCMKQNSQIRVAYKGDIPIASIFTLTTKTTLLYKYGCNDFRYNNLGGTVLLLWNAIQQAKANGLEELDMGRSDVANTGLITFKEHWGAERSAINYWRFPVQAASENPERLVKYAKKLISIAPDQALSLLGNLLYRHVG